VSKNVHNRGRAMIRPWKATATWVKLALMCSVYRARRWLPTGERILKQIIPASRDCELRGVVLSADGFQINTMEATPTNKGARSRGCNNGCVDHGHATSQSLIPCRIHLARAQTTSKQILEGFLFPTREQTYTGERKN
jgi:hypothetical protein